MAAGSTYTPIATTTANGSSGVITFNSFGTSYTDLVLICNGFSGASVDVGLQFNNDTGTNYSRVYLEGTGSASGSAHTANASIMLMNNYGYPTSGAYSWMASYYIMNYSNSTSYKTVLGRSDNGNNGTNLTAGLWRSTAAITSISIKTTSSTFGNGTTFTLYGIAAA